MTKKDIDLLKEKDEKAFEKFYYKYNRLFFSIVYKKTFNFSVTENLVQETFLKVMEDIESYRGGNFKYWVLTICKNITNMYLRKAIREKEILQEEQLVKDEEESEVESAINPDDVLLKIKKIVDIESYEIIVMHLVKKMKFREIGELKGQTIGSVLGKYHRALKLIRSQLDYEKD